MLTESLSKKYFGDENPIGKLLSRNNGVDYTVTGVSEDLPPNTFKHYDALISLAGREKIFGKWNIDSRKPEDLSQLC